MLLISKLLKFIVERCLLAVVGAYRTGAVIQGRNITCGKCIYIRLTVDSKVMWVGCLKTRGNNYAKSYFIDDHEYYDIVVSITGIHNIISKSIHHHVGWGCVCHACECKALAYVHVSGSLSNGVHNAPICYTNWFYEIWLRVIFIVPR